MSDIGICMTGVPLFLAVLLTTILYALIAIVCGAIAALRGRDQDPLWRIARTGTGLTIVSAIVLAAILFYMDAVPCPSAPTWIDWLSVPWLISFPVGCLMIFRWRKAKA